MRDRRRKRDVFIQRSSDRSCTVLEGTQRRLGIMWDKQRNILQNEAGRRERKEVSGRLTRFISAFPATREFLFRGNHSAFCLGIAYPV